MLIHKIKNINLSFSWPGKKIWPCNRTGGKVHPIEQVHATVAQFPGVKGSGDPGYTGDLEVSISLLTVSGRGGLNYDINLQWVFDNGVPAQESASWVGQGWNLSQYQITCTPNYKIKGGINSDLYNISSSSVSYSNRVMNDTKDAYLKDHLGSIRVKVDKDGEIDSYNDYYPFGAISRNSINRSDYRYKFTGKERDEETNWDYFGARYYDSIIARWMSVDPKAIISKIKPLKLLCR